MKLIAHRGLWTEPGSQNTLASFRTAFAAGYDLETDLRSFQGRLYLSHDPIIDPASHCRLEALFILHEEFPDRRIFLNIKEDGLSTLLRPFLSQISARPIVFFDMSVPELVRFARIFSAPQLCTRLSEFEIRPAGIELCDWIWVDSFYKDPDLSALSLFITQQRKSLVLVSPELHGRNPESLWGKLYVANGLNPESLSLCTDSCAYAAKTLFPHAPSPLREPHDQSHTF